MRVALSTFDANLARARDLVSLSEHLEALTTGALNLDDILRAALVHGVSAIDHFIHQVVRLGMLEVQAGSRGATPAFAAFPIPLGKAQDIAMSPMGGLWLEEAIRQNHGWQTFQHPEKIANALRLVTGVRVWDEVGRRLQSDAATVKARMIAIADRRNKIAHEADTDPSFPGQRWPISRALVTEAIDFLEAVAKAIVGILLAAQPADEAADPAAGTLV